MVCDHSLLVMGEGDRVEAAEKIQPVEVDGVLFGVPFRIREDPEAVDAFINVVVQRAGGWDELKSKMEVGA
jgi:hypothetical protein